MQLNTITKYRETEINENTMVRNLVTPETMDLKIPLHSFDKLIEMKFEDAKFKVIPNYDEYLRKSYGNYMQLPPEEERIPGHGVTTYWK